MKSLLILKKNFEVSSRKNQLLKTLDDVIAAVQLRTNSFICQALARDIGGLKKKIIRWMQEDNITSINYTIEGNFIGCEIPSQNLMNYSSSVEAEELFLFVFNKDIDIIFSKMYY